MPIGKVTEEVEGAAPIRCAALSARCSHVASIVALDDG
jgi:hypothetical protein